MTEFKGKNGEGVRPSRAAEGKLETGVGSPAGRKYGGGAGRGGLGPSAPSSIRFCREIPYVQSSSHQGGFFPVRT